MNSLNPLKNYVRALIENIDKENLPKEIDLIIDGGAFNGAYGYGILIYLKELEKLNLIKINKISGCSIGALLAVLFITNSIDENIILYEKILNSFRETTSLISMKKIINDFVNKHVSNIEDLNNKLFITYYDVSTLKQVVVNNYKSKDELIQILIRSSYIPYITNGDLQYDSKYCDGCTPYIFSKTKNKTLFIYFMKCNKIISALYTKHENNIWSRLLNGIVDINNFFSGSNSQFCSYINNWTVFDFILLRIREIIILFFLTIIKIYIEVSKHIPENFKNNKFINRTSKILNHLYKDIFSYIIL